MSLTPPRIYATNDGNSRRGFWHGLAPDRCSRSFGRYIRRFRGLDEGRRAGGGKILMLTDEQVMIRDMARTYAQERLAPTAQAREKAGVIEPEIVTELGELGFLGMTIDPDWGGAGADYVSYALAMMEIAAGDGSVSTMVSVHNAWSARCSTASAPTSRRSAGWSRSSRGRSGRTSG